MNHHSQQNLAARREELLHRSTQLREQLARRAPAFRPALRVADKVRESARWAQRNPAWMLAGTAALVGMAAVRPGAALRLATRAWSGWRLLRRVQPIAAGLMRQFF